MAFMPKKLLIVEDDPDTVEMLRVALTAANYTVNTALTGPEALSKAHDSPPDLVLLDLILPEMNGFDVCERLRRDPVTESVPIIIVTALPGELPRLAGKEAGANAYIRKPFEVQELVSRVGQLLAQCHTSPANAGQSQRLIA
jgi:DNA-binding response OmpR family regulator